MPTRVAITIAGAVSLGSYEAGVIYELLEAFRTHNQQAAPDAKIYVDVVTGASAGGMTAAMLAQRLMFDGPSLGSDEAKDGCAFTNPLYQAWVEKIDIKGLVSLGKTENKWHSLLSSDLVAKIGKEMLVDSMAPGQPLRGPHAAVELDEKNKPLPIDVGVAITNLNGVDYLLRIDGNPDQGFNYARSVDQMLFHINARDRGNTAMWQRLRGAAVACGAFPAAFRPQELLRRSCEYGTPLPDPPSLGEIGKTYVDWTAPGKPKVRAPGTLGFAYTDGGVLQNQPLGIAKNFVDRRKQLAPAEDTQSIAGDRLYVFVSPNAVTSTARQGFAAKDLTILGALIEVLYTYVRQATFHDWITAEGMNQSVHLLDQRAAELAEKIAAGSLDTNALALSASQLNGFLIPDQGLRSKAIARLKVQYQTEYHSVFTAQGEPAATAFLDAVATLEVAAELNERDVMKIVAVIADGRTELAGSGISAFAGFFNKEFREHDYWMGRVKTRVYLQRSDVKRILKVKKWRDEDAWGGTTETDVKAALENPTSITSLPLSFSKMIKPGLTSLLRLVWIRSWPVAVALILLLVLAILRSHHR
jgi:hypothetical protein